MKDTRAVPRYARALFELASERGELETVDRDFAKVRELVDRYPEISHLLLNSTIALSEKEDFIDKIVPSDLSHSLLNFIKVLVKKRRFTDIRAIQKDFHHLYEKKEGIQEVEVITAAPLSPASTQKLTRALKERLAVEIRLVPKTDRDMIGGMILRFDGTEINSSFRDRLQEIKQRLME